MPDPNPSSSTSHRPSQGRPPILTLPMELLTQVAETVNPRDLASLRLARKDLCTASTKVFGVKCLAHRRSIFSEYSMKGLVDLTAHPVFGPCVRSVCFGVRRAESNLVTLMNALEGSKYANASSNEQMRILRCHFAAAKRRKGFLYYGKHTKAVSSAMTNLKAYGNDVTFGIYDEKQCRSSTRNSPMTGYETEEMYGTLSLDTWEVRLSKTLAVIYGAARESNYLLTSLAVHLEDND